MKNLLLICSLLVLFIGTSLQAEPITIGEKFTIQSAILKEERPYLVHLPVSYEGNKSQLQKYPVLYILDGSSSFVIASSIVSDMATSTQIPEHIVVAIPNTTDRTRDLTPNNSIYGYDGERSPDVETSGGGDKFLQFIEQELIPQINKNYRTMDYTTFAGHSFGGLTVLHSFLSQQGLFDNYLAIDSSLWWDHRIMLKRVKKFVGTHTDSNARIFMSTADRTDDPNGEGMAVPNRTFFETLKNSGFPNLHVAQQSFKNEDHGSVPLPSLYYGLLNLFDGYKIKRDVLLEGADAVAKHYEVFSKARNTVFLPPEEMIGDFAKWFTEDKPHLAQGFFELNAANYPTSEKAQKQLAEYLKTKK
ncbi:MAG: alpha/beta hydrolase [Kordiimonadaceae bacterium]|nr:alpha/beta hydrolase [Kordiimonadaceae bacterium]